MSRLRAGLALLLAAATPAAAQQLAYEGSLGMTTGRYIFTTPTTTFTLSTGLALTTGPLTLRASLPVWLQNSTVITASGPGGALPSGGSSGGTVGDSGRGGRGGGGGMNTVATARARRVEMPASAFTDYRAAIGDPILGATVMLRRDGSLSFGLGGMVKLPLADTAHYGTGEWDAGATASASIRVNRTTMLGADAAWWYLGDLPDLDFNNPVSGSLTFSHLRATRWAFSLFVRASTAAVPGFTAPATAGGGITWLSRRVAIGLEAGAGLTETSPDLGLTAYWRVQAP